MQKHYRTPKSTLLFMHFLWAHLPFTQKASSHFTPKITQGFLALLLVFLCACAKDPQVVPLTPVAPPKEEAPPVEAPKKSEAEIIWDKYLATAKMSMTPFRNQLTLRYGVEGKTDRAAALLWGNSSKEIRLDINAGVGISVAKVYEGPKDFILYLPREKTAYLYSGKEKPLFTIGVPMPLGLAHLTEILTGQYAKVFGEEYTDIMPIKDAELPANLELPSDAKAYALMGHDFEGTLVLNTEGLPLYWQGDDGHGWTMELSYRDGGKQPYKLNIQHISSKRRALLLVKERSSKLPAFRRDKLRLTFPKSTAVKPLEKLGQN